MRPLSAGLLAGLCSVLLSMTGWAQTPIATLADLDNIRNDPSGSYVLMGDIDASETADPNYNGGLGWQPIENFTGSLTAVDTSPNSANITNLTIHRASTDDVGLFQAISGSALISRVSLIDATIQGAQHVGGFAGRQQGGTISECYVSGTVSGFSSVGGIVGLCTAGIVTLTSGGATVTGNNTVGGLVGAMEGGEISGGLALSSTNATATMAGGIVGRQDDGVIFACTFSNAIVRGGNAIGGIVGQQSPGAVATIADCYGWGSVAGTAVQSTASAGGLVGELGGRIIQSESHVDVDFGAYAGGLVGHATGGIDRCVAIGTVTGGVNTLAGGLVGVTEGTATITDSYAADAVISLSYAGGLVGWNNGSAITNCFALGDVTNSLESTGGLVGRHGGGALAKCFSIGQVNTNEGGGFIGVSLGGVSESYWNTESSGQPSSAGGGGAMARNTDEMTLPFDTNTYVGWNFSDVWTSGSLSYENNGYPFHRWQTQRYTLKYQAGSGGSISGVGTQSRIPGAKGTAVTAIPNTSHHFVQWSDGVLTPSRVDRAIANSALRTAQFAADTFTLTYLATAGGTISGAASQTVGYATNGQEVTAVPDTANNYIFLRWSDGSTQNPRTDTNVTGDITVTAEFAITIGTLAEFSRMTESMQAFSRSYVLTADIDASPTSTAGWVPIGDVVFSFNGRFDGQGHKIHNLTVDLPLNDRAGLFGMVSAGGQIANVHLVNAMIHGQDWSGALAGVCSGSISGCSVTGEVTGHDHLGGLVGWSRGQLTGCFSGADTTGATDVGGLAGLADGDAVIAECYATGGVTVLGSMGGGLVGRCEGTPGTATTRDSYSTGSVNCPEIAGGLAGANSARVTRAFSTGAVTGTGFVGGLIGASVIGTTTASYWNTETSTQVISQGGSGRTTDEMTVPFDANTYVGWDFEDVWTSGTLSYENNGYPFLRWQTIRHTLQYTAGTGGTITGETTQTRIPGAHGTTVTAVPNPGYIFTGWSDGVSQPSRTDHNVVADIAVTAHFADAPPTPTPTATPTTTPVAYTVQQAIDKILGVSAIPADRNADGVVDAADTKP